MQKVWKKIKMFWIKVKMVIFPFWKENKDDILNAIEYATKLSKDSKEIIKKLKKEWKQNKK